MGQNFFPQSSSKASSNVSQTPIFLSTAAWSAAHLASWYPLAASGFPQANQNSFFSLPASLTSSFHHRIWGLLWQPLSGTLQPTMDHLDSNVSNFPRDLFLPESRVKYLPDAGFHQRFPTEYHNKLGVCQFFPAFCPVSGFTLPSGGDKFFTQVSKTYGQWLDDSITKLIIDLWTRVLVPHGLMDTLTLEHGVCYKQTEYHRSLETKHNSVSLAPIVVVTTSLCHGATGHKSA